LRQGFTQPWHAAWCDARIEDRVVVLTGYAFRLGESEIGAGAPEEDRWIPLPPDQMRFGFTVLGAVKRAPPGAPDRPVAARLVVRPNPARGPVRVEAPGAGVLRIFDVRGRTLWRGTSEGPGAIVWPGTDAAGRVAAPGVYLIRFEGPSGTRTTRIVRLS